MNEKIGEANIIELFKTILKDKILHNQSKIKFIESTMCGKDDRKFADYFASINSMNILIEFKEFEKEIRNEKKKPLRKKLCEEIGEHINATRKGHFIAWSKNNENNSRQIIIDNYIFRVSNIFGLKLNKVRKTEYKCIDFINLLLERKIGLRIKTFSKYIDFLKILANDDPGDGGAFNGILLSYHDGKLVSSEIQVADIFYLLNLIENKIEEESTRYRLEMLTKKENYKKPKPEGSTSSRVRRRKNILRVYKKRNKITATKLLRL